MHSLVVIDASDELSSLATARLQAQVRTAGAEAQIFHDPAALMQFLATSIAGGPIALIDARLITSQVVIDAIVKSASNECRALVEKTVHIHPQSAARVAHKKIQSASSVVHRVTQPSHNLLGAVTLASTVDVSDAIRTAVNFSKTIHTSFNVVDLLVVALVRCAIDVAPLETTGILSLIHI